MRKVIRKRIRINRDGVNLVGDVNAVISANVGQDGATSTTSSRQRVVQRSRSRVVASKSGEPRTSKRRRRDPASPKGEPDA
jgi:hypothetical protein